ncbi:uncharacterized protein LOC127256857 isoform X3 [Andrographis paniculata]|uniref:uncharacterized protein LOC127256857 isoform X3 n=1 Tax=Andrographis paniculata TaxID=175694 RepID=UPI0021E943C7|nr:uncharacterized protein LOC127256857 isoform X3 [Andrographis paniculata]
MMRGVGGPLLCISDLLSDVGEDNNGVGDDRGLPPGAAGVSDLPASELPRLFQQNFDELKRALDGADPCWTALTLKIKLMMLLMMQCTPALFSAGNCEQIGRLSQFPSSLFVRAGSGA